MTALTADRAAAPIDRLRAFIEDETGIQLPASKRTMVESRLKKRVIALGLPDCTAYLRHLFDEGGLAAERDELIDLLTTNKTDFYREPAHFHLFASRVLPEALARARPGHRIRFRLWSAAASTGAEAWTAAMILARAAEGDPRLDWAILGTDISPGVIQVARRAIYPLSEVQPLPEALREAYLMTGQGGPVAGPRVRIVPEVRARVRFELMNLTRFPFTFDAPLDVVFLRNVLIYFDPEMQARVVAACAQTLRPGGYLFVGHSESMIVRQAALHQVAPGVFRKGEAG